MIRRGKLLFLSGCLAASGCAVNHPLQVRAISDPNSKLHYSGGLLAEARGQLAMGAVGLALESLRTLQREQPDSADVYAGIAACYAAMGRFDLTRTNYELALAYAPDDPALLQALAMTLDKIGDREQAAQVRSEVRLASARSQATAPPSVETPLGVPRAISMTVKLPQARTVIVAPQMAQVELKNAQVDLPVGRRAALGEPALVANADFATPEVAPRAVAPHLTQDEAIARVPASVLAGAIVALPTAGARKVERAQLAADVIATIRLPQEHRALASATVKVDAPRAPEPRPIEVNDVAATSERSLYLQRTSLGEVALVTAARSTAETKIHALTLQLVRLALSPALAPLTSVSAMSPAPHHVAASAIRWLPLRYASGSQSVELLNAARSDHLAARNRVALLDRGWRKIGVGNAREVRLHSLVLYAPGRSHLAARLAAEFQCKAVKALSVKNVIVLLGRDAVRLPSSRA